jgi:hypothetical protein
MDRSAVDKVQLPLMASGISVKLYGELGAIVYTVVV